MPPLLHTDQAVNTKKDDEPAVGPPNLSTLYEIGGEEFTPIPGA
jgi:hypothetical protein